MNDEEIYPDDTPNGLCVIFNNFTDERIGTCFCQKIILGEYTFYRDSYLKSIL